MVTVPVLVSTAIAGDLGAIFFSRSLAGIVIFASASPFNLYEPSSFFLERIYNHWPGPNYLLHHYR